MGFDADGNLVFDNEVVRRYLEAYGGSGTFPNQYTYSRDQFYKLTDSEPYPIDRRMADNPPFLWPSNQYMDSAGNTGKVQRGYMRSLISDPQVDVTKTMKNRRLFFQFNPQVLVRSVQQTPGAMNPLLQDPAQLVQPVPGTTSFGFELMFNREHEVNAGYNDDLTEWLHLPNGQKALVSEIGVLADLMILDTITGQGMSEDMINAVVSRSKRQYQNINDANAKARQELKDAGIEEETLDYQPLDVPEDSDLKAIFENNLGNSAFLNPQPFRVIFSSLFMVEGVATSVEVVFQKFSRTMVPTQCKVVINMYALYFGFAKAKTFIFDNLVQSATETREAEESDFNITYKFLTGVKKFTGALQAPTTVPENPNGAFPTVSSPYFSVYGIGITDSLKEFLETNEVTEANFSFDLEYAFSTSNATQYSDETLSANRLTLKQDGTKVNFNAKGTRQVDRLYAIPDNETDISIFQTQVVVGRPYSVRYITYRVIMVIHATSKEGRPVQQNIPGSVVYNAEWVDGVTGDNVTDVSTYTYTPPVSGVTRLVAQ